MLLHWPLAAGHDVRERLITAWSTDRSTVTGYHDLRHLAEVLNRIDDLGATDNVEVVLAAWFHDAVYDSAGDNEERSARLAADELAPFDETVDVDEVARLVRLTEHHRPEEGDENGAILCDADLAVLAASGERYREYVADVRREYAEVPDAEFTLGRLAVLRDLAAKPSLFGTPLGRELWEERARANLSAEITNLEDRSFAAADRQH